MRLQSGNPGLAVGDADNRYLRLAGGDVVGAVSVTKAAPSVYPADATMPPAYLVAQTWANAGKTWSAFNVEVTDTASGAASLLANFSVATTSKFAVRKDGGLTTSGNFAFYTGTTLRGYFLASNGQFYAVGNANIDGTNGLSLGEGTGTPVGLARADANTLEVTNGTAGTLRDLKARAFKDQYGNQVVGDRQATVADPASADATDLASALTLVNELKAQIIAALAMLRVHGLHT